MLLYIFKHSLIGHCNLAEQADKTFGQGRLAFLPFPYTKRLILASTGPINLDYDDVRRYGDIARKAIIRAKAAGAQKPLLYFPQYPTFPRLNNLVEVSLLSCLSALYEVRQLRL